MWHLTQRTPKEGEILEGNARFEGYSLDLIDAVARHIGFKYRFELAPDGKYGGFNKVTKKWDGLIKQLLERVSLHFLSFFQNQLQNTYQPTESRFGNL